MKIEWDEAKRIKNIRKHGIDFIDAQLIFRGYTVTIDDFVENYGEMRFVTYGFMYERLIAVVHTHTDTTIRIISARKANKDEQKRFFAKIPD